MHVLGGIIVQYLMSILLNIRQIYSRLQFFFFFGLCVILLLPIYYNDKKKNEGKNMCYHVIHVIFFIFIFLYKRMRLM